MTRKAALLAIVLCLGALPSFAEGLGDLVSDRPDFTESTLSIPRGHVQLELGMTYEDLDGADLETYGELLVRLGLGGGWEARIGVPSYQRLDTSGRDLSGFGDVSIGAKRALGQFGGTDVAVLVATSVPTASGDFESSSWQPDAALALAWELPNGWSLGSNIGWTYADGGDDRFHQYRVSVALGVPTGSRSGAFFEAYAFSEEYDGGDTATYVDAGLTYLVNDDLQLDARIGYGLSDAEVDLFFGAGLVARW